MTIRDVQNIMESWAPEETAWEHDNTGLQIGSADQRIKNILVALDISEKVLEEAKRKKIDLVISHHPLLFHPLKRINLDDRIGRLVNTSINNGIAVYSAHTNLDFTTNGVSFALAQRLGLNNIDFLLKNKRIQKKIIVFVPHDHVVNVIEAMANAGAGCIGNYDSCSFSSEGNGTFKPGEKANPYVGKIGRMEHVREIRLEMVAPSWKVDKVITALKEAHPYEEVVFDIYDLANVSCEFGEGAIGEFTRSIDTKKFLGLVAHKLNLPAIRFGSNQKRWIKRVAVCGGSGSDLLTVAIKQSADAFITSDISYHRFAETNDKIVIIDAGHFETESPVIRNVVHHLKQEMKRQKYKARVFESRVLKNHIQYFIP